MSGGLFGVYGAPPQELAETPAGALQLSPLVPGSQAIEDLPDAAMAGAVVLAPPGTLERRYVLAHAVRALAAGARLTVLAPKDKGGARIEGELEAFGCAVEVASRRHFRICTMWRPTQPVGLAAAMEDGAPRRIEGLGLWSQPGVFSWDRIDAGSAMLAAELPRFAGIGADLGCGIGTLARAVLAASPEVARLTLVDADRRAVDCARRNVEDARARFQWADVRDLAFDAGGIDFVVMNPPFHDGGAEDRALGQSFIRRAAEILKPGGRCWLVANRHLPYEAAMAPVFKTVRAVQQRDGYKICEAVR